MTSNVQDAQSVGFIGLGRMGRPMARHLEAAGHRVHVFDVNPERVERATSGTRLCAEISPRAVAAHVGTLFSALPDDATVTQTYLGADGVLAGALPGLVTCDCSTVSSEVSRTIAAAAQERGVTHLDTPMLGSSPQAESGEIFFMIGGDATKVSVVQPYLQAMGRLSMYVGSSGTANRIKLLHNALGAVNAVAVAESLALCVDLGVDPRTFYEVVRNGGGMAYSTYFDRRVLRLVEGDYRPTFTLDLMLKDVTLALRMAAERAAAMPILREALSAYTEARASGWGSEDFSAVTHVVEGRFGRSVNKNEGAAQPPAAAMPSR